MAAEGAESKENEEQPPTGATKCVGGAPGRGDAALRTLPRGLPEGNRAGEVCMYCPAAGFELGRRPNSPHLRGTGHLETVMQPPLDASGTFF